MYIITDNNELILYDNKTKNLDIVRTSLEFATLSPSKKYLMLRKINNTPIRAFQGLIDIQKSYIHL